MTTKTTEPLEQPLTNLRALEIMRDHCISQGEPCIVGSMCIYQGDDGKRCAFGAIIPDDRIKSASGSAGDTISNELSLGYTWCENLDMQLMNDAQWIHDGSNREDGFKSWVTQVTTKFNALIHRVQNGEFATGETK